MAKSLNRVMLIGNLGKDPEVRYTASSVPVCTFSMAMNENWQDADGNMQERVEWANIVAWKKLAEICHQYLLKGSKVYVEGRLQTRSWDDPATGQKKYMTEVVISNMLMLDGKPQGEPASRPRSEPMAVNPQSGKAEGDLPF
jgi:single-strand DNA-binding protein